MVCGVMGSLGEMGPSLLQGWTWLMSLTCHVTLQVSSLLTPSAPCCRWLDLHVLPLHAISCHLTCGSWWSGGAFSLTSSTAGKEHRSVEGSGDAVLECTGEAGPSRTLAPKHPAIRHVAAACAVSPSPPVTAP